MRFRLAMLCILAAAAFAAAALWRNGPAGTALAGFGLGLALAANYAFLLLGAARTQPASQS